MRVVLGSQECRHSLDPLGVARVVIFWPRFFPGIDRADGDPVLSRRSCVRFRGRVPVIDARHAWVVVPRRGKSRLSKSVRAVLIPPGYSSSSSNGLPPIPDFIVPDLWSLYYSCPSLSLVKGSEKPGLRPTTNTLSSSSVSLSVTAHWLALTQVDYTSPIGIIPHHEILAECRTYTN